MTFPEIIRELERRPETPANIKRMIRNNRVRGYSEEQIKKLTELAFKLGVLRS